MPRSLINHKQNWGGGGGDLNLAAVTCTNVLDCHLPERLRGRVGQVLEDYC